MKRLLHRLSQQAKAVNYWLVAQAAKAAISLLRRLPADRALAFAERVARRIGPWTGRHRVALDNLRHAYPELTEAEREAIASDMWANMARLGTEYIFLDQLFDYRPGETTPGRVEVVGEHIFERLREEKKPHIIFTAHIGNFELLPVAAAAFGLDVAVMFRPPNNPYIADYVFSTRRSNMGKLLASAPGVAFALSRILERNGNIGVLVDQKFHNGVRTRFFGRECGTSPLVPRLARHYECDVYPALCVRLPGNRFRLELKEKLELPENADGTVDVAATAQLLNNVVEGWVRATPGQWMWFHNRWQIAPRKRG